MRNSVLQQTSVQITARQGSCCDMLRGVVCKIGRWMRTCIDRLTATGINCLLASALQRAFPISYHFFIFVGSPLSCQWSRLGVNVKNTSKKQASSRAVSQICPSGLLRHDPLDFTVLFRQCTKFASMFSWLALLRRPGGWGAERFTVIDAGHQGVNSCQS